MGAAPILLISEATLLAVVALAAIVVVAMVVLALVVLNPHAPAAPTSVPASQATTFSIPLPAPLPKPAATRTTAGGRTLEVDVPTRHVDEFMAALRASGWRVHETGEVVATDEDEEGLTTILVDLPGVPHRTASGEEIR